jgi:hypothetical protein
MSNKSTPVVATMGSDIGKNSFHVVGLDRRGAIVSASAGPPERGEGPVVGIERHLLRPVRVDPHEHHAAVTEPDMGRLHDDRHPVRQDSRRRRADSEACHRDATSRLPISD